MVNNKIDNKGVTLIELIVVILIMAILAGGALISASVIHDGNVAAAQETLISMLTNARKTSIAKEDGRIMMKIEPEDGKYYVRLYYDTDGNGFDENYELLDDRKLCSDAISITIFNEVIDENGLPVRSSSYVSQDSAPVEFQFRKSDGSLVNPYFKVVLEGSDTKEIDIIRETGRCVAHEYTVEPSEAPTEVPS